MIIFQNVVKKMFPDRLYVAIRWLLALTFIYAGITKLVDPQSFAVIIDAYGLIPESWVMPVAVLLPLAEVVAGAGLIRDIRGSLSAITGLLLLFMAILGYGIRMGLDVDCGCFGPEDPEGLAYAGIRPALYRDMVMMLAVIYLYGWRVSRCGSGISSKKYLIRGE
ncbi:DoxX family protein [Desulfonema ishimotonii]|uniref:DoxX family protein n=1 Tax=Desulfonema ishimotonii TaxID=45657 RepID=A0A401G2R8_9BACT|nr:MauE/DoxX family redox-associated membrane protein [Desulfonema ishimotonii]GBC63538.1 DoxX family protein [Desulfonema ishimotonii]